MQTDDTPCDIDILLCYRGRYRLQVEALAQRLRGAGLRVTYDVEILAGDAPFSETPPATQELRWFDLQAPDVDGSQANDPAHTAWRAPLHQAIARAALSVFLYDARDTSENVMNEIAWVSRAQRPVFFVIDTGSGATSEEYECIVLGVLQSWFGLARETMATEIPHFGYHFIAQDDPNAINERLDVLGHRILAYRDLLRHHGVPMLRLDNDLTLDDVRSAPLQRGRSRLRAIQRRVAALGLPPAEVAACEAASREVFGEVLAQLHERERGATVNADTGRLRFKDSPFSYPQEAERRRLQRTEDIAQRVRPGGFESPNYFAMLARQTASIEVLIEDGWRARQTEQDPNAPPGVAAPYQPPILFGTLPLSASRSTPLVSCERDNAVLLLNAAFIDLCYRLIKLCVRSWLPSSTPGVNAVSFVTQAKTTHERLDALPELAADLAQWLYNYCTQGRTHAPADMPSPEEQLPLQLLTACAERFTLAHGYAQIGQLGNTNATADAPTALVIEARAVQAVLASAAQGDLVDPMIALQGCLLAIHADEMANRALALFPNDGSYRLPEMAPPWLQRVAAAQAAYLALAQAGGMSEADARHACDTACEAAATAWLIWERAQPAFKQRIGPDARPFSMWIISAR